MCCRHEYKSFSNENAGSFKEIFAIPVSKVDQKINEESIDVILIGPQIRYMEKRIKEKMAVKHIPVGVIPMEDYGRMDGTKVLKYAYSLMNKG